MELRNSLEGSLQVQLPGTLVFDYPSISAIAQYISSTAGAAVADGAVVEGAKYDRFEQVGHRSEYF